LWTIGGIIGVGAVGMMPTLVHGDPGHDGRVSVVQPGF
jgi:hypothetical protein